MNKNVFLDGFLSLLLWRGAHGIEVQKKELDCLPLEPSILPCIVTGFNIQKTVLHNALVKLEMQLTTTVQ